MLSCRHIVHFSSAYYLPLLSEEQLQTSLRKRQEINMDCTNALFHTCCSPSDLDVLSYPTEDFINGGERIILTEHIKINYPSRVGNWNK